MDERIGAARALELGNELRRYREAAGISGHTLAMRLGWSASKVSRIETGMIGVGEIDVVRFAAHCGVTGPGIDDLLDLFREPGAPGFWLSRRLSTLILHENIAASSASYDALAVPGLLQTQEYATELISAEGLEHSVAEPRIAARMERQRVLHTRPFTFFVHEQALRLPVGGGRVMNEQLLKLALLAEQPQIRIRVVPSALGASSVFEGDFVLFHYATHDPVVRLPAAGLYLEDRDQVAQYQNTVTRLSEIALDRDNRGRSSSRWRASSTDRRTLPMTPTTWRKSSYSAASDSNCVQVAWRKSSYSTASDDNCVEVALAPTGVAVRDSKNTTGPTLSFDSRGWRSFLTSTAGA